MTSEELTDLVEKHVASLREHVDSVRIFVSVDPEEGNSVTRHCDSGSGNIFTQIGMVHDWLIEMDEETRKDVRERE